MLINLGFTLSSKTLKVIISNIKAHVARPWNASINKVKVYANFSFQKGLTPNLKEVWL